MKRIYHLLALTLIAFTSVITASCVFSENISGDGHKVTSNREVTPFIGVSASAGVEVNITMGDKEEVVVECDENLQKYVKVEVENKILHISKKSPFLFNSKIKVHVTAKIIERLESSSGSIINVNNEIDGDMLKIEASSGAVLNATTKTKYLTCDASSGSIIKLIGSTSVISIECSSGSQIDANGLSAETAKFDCSSGSNASVQVLEEIEGEATSGAHVSVKGKPKMHKVHSSSGGGFDFE